MPRTSSDPDGPLETLTVRFPVSYLYLLDLIAEGLSDRTGRRASRGEALREVVAPVLDAVAAQEDVSRAIRRARATVTEIARAGAYPARGRRRRDEQLDLEGLLDALGVEPSAVRELARSVGAGTRRARTGKRSRRS